MSRTNENAETAKRLLAVTREDWKDILSKCYTHIEMRLFGRTKWGAHCEQRLGMLAQDFYTGRAVEGIFSFSWKWKYSLYSLEEQLIRIIDSLISKEVEKYRSEQRRGRQTYLMEPGQIGLFHENKPDEQEEPINLEKFYIALETVCTAVPLYEQFIKMKRDKCSYDEISERLGMNKTETYRLRDTIARKATQKLKTL